MTNLVIFAFACVPRCRFQSTQECSFVNLLHVGMAGKPSGTELQSVKSDQGVPVGKQPGLHRLDHQVAVRIRQVRRLPTVSLPEVSPRRGSHRIFRVHQKHIERVRMRPQRCGKILKKHEIKDSEICYIGDDLIDLPILRKVGFSVAVPNAPSEVKENVSYITNAPGGYGAIREITEKILKSQGKWDAIISRYF